MVFDPFLQFFPIRMGEKLGEKVDGCFHIRRCGSDAFKTGLFAVQFFPVAGKFADAVDTETDASFFVFKIKGEFQVSFRHDLQKLLICFFR